MESETYDKINMKSNLALRVVKFNAVNTTFDARVTMNTVVICDFVLHPLLINYLFITHSNAISNQKNRYDYQAVV